MAPIPDLQVYLDAAGSVGYGAILGSEWFVGRWPSLQMSIAYKELIPVVLPASLWKHQFLTKTWNFVVEVLRSGA